MKELIEQIKSEVGALVDAQGLYRAMLVVDIAQKLDELAREVQNNDADNG